MGLCSNEKELKNHINELEAKLKEANRRTEKVQRKYDQLKIKVGENFPNCSNELIEAAERNLPIQTSLQDDINRVAHLAWSPIRDQINKEAKKNGFKLENGYKPIEFNVRGLYKSGI